MEIELVAGKFELPPEKKYLLRYFKTDIERKAVPYFLLFGNTTLFTDHTGYYCTDRWLRKIKRRIRLLEEAHRQARATMDSEAVATIESGKYKV